MKYKLPIVVFFIFLVSLGILNGWGLPLGENIYPYIIFLFPSVLFLIDVIKNYHIHIPVKATLIYLLFLIFSSISMINAVHIQRAFEYQLFYSSVFLLFLYVYNHKVELKKNTIFFINIISLCSLIYAVLLHYFLATNSFFIPLKTYQFVYKYSENVSHHPLAILLVLPAIIFLYKSINEGGFRNLLIFIILLWIILISYTRAAYIALFIASLPLIFLHKHKNKQKLLVLALLGLVLISSFLFITTINRSSPFTNKVQQILHKYGGLQDKTLLSGRDKYLQQGLEAISERPFIGYGSNNFYYIAKKYAKSEIELPNSSHNLFLDIISENGIIAFICYLTITILLFIKSFHSLKSHHKEDQYLYALLIGLFVIFQFSFYYKVQFLYLLYFVIAGLIYQEGKNVVGTDKILLYSSISLFLIGSILLISRFMYSTKQYKRALTLYPIFFDAYPKAIKQTLDDKDYSNTNRLLNKYSFYYPDEPSAQNFIGSVYLKLLDSQNAMLHFENTLLYPRNTYAIEQVYRIIKINKGEQEARQFLLGHQYATIPYDDQRESTRYCLENIVECD